MIGIGEDADSFYDGDVVGSYIDQVSVSRQLKNDPVHKKVMETMQSLQRRDSNMDFEEDLVKAAYRRKHIIEQATIDAKQDEERTSKRRTRNQNDLCRIIYLNDINLWLCFHFIQYRSSWL